MQQLAFEIITPVFGNSFKLETFDESNVNHYKSWHITLKLNLFISMEDQENARLERTCRTSMMVILF
jgi:hypothetical protein